MKFIKLQLMIVLVLALLAAAVLELGISFRELITF